MSKEYEALVNAYKLANGEISGDVVKEEIALNYEKSFIFNADFGELDEIIYDEGIGNHVNPDHYSEDELDTYREHIWDCLKEMDSNIKSIKNSKDVAEVWFKFIEGSKTTPSPKSGYLRRKLLLNK